MAPRVIRPDLEAPRRSPSIPSSSGPAKFSMRRERCSLQDRGPPRNFRLHQASETRRRSLPLGGNRSAQVGEPLPDGGVIERLVQRSGELGDDFFRRASRGENASPNTHLIVDPALFGIREVGTRNQGLLGGNQ